MNIQSGKVVAAAIISTLMFENDNDDSDEEQIVLYEMTRKRKRKRLCIKGYQYIAESYLASDFRRHFRISKTTFQSLLERIGKQLETPKYVRGRPSNDATRQLMIALWMLANQECYRTIADRFDVTVSMAWDYFHKVIDAIVGISKEIIMWPSSSERIKREQEFFQIRGMIRGVVGAIDGSHIPIAAPKYMPNSYVNRNKYHSVVLQVVCDNNYRFLDCFAGCPGSVHDARVLRMSPLGKKLLNNDAAEMISPNQHLLADSAYPNTINIITPYRDNGRLTRKQKTFNYKHSSTRVVIEQALGLLKGRFRILKFINIYNTEFIPKVIISCCTLHNLCIDLGDISDIEMHQDENLNDDINNLVNIRDDPAGIIKRDNLANLLYNR